MEGGAVEPRNIALLGVGRMGLALGQRLLAAGHSLVAWNRTPARAQGLSHQGARLAASPQEAVRGADAVVISLVDGPSVEAVLFTSDAYRALRPDAVVIDTSSVPPRTARDHANRLAALGVAYVDAPVSGGVHGAETGTLAVMVGGSATAFERAAPLLTCIGRAAHLGPAGSGQVCKLVNQTIVGVTIAGVAEAILLAGRAGLDPEAARQALFGGFADSPILRRHGSMMIDRSFAAGGRSSIQLKDLQTVCELADEIGLELPVVSLVRDLYRALVAAGHGDLDHSALLLEEERRSP